jgi:hypothetical protein
MTFKAGQIDPNVKIPDAIKARAAAADAAFNAAYGQESSNDDGVQETNEAEENTSSEAKEAEASASEAKVTSESNEQPTHKSEDDQSWEHRYKSMKGRYDRAESQIRQMSDQITGLQNLLSTMQTPSNTPAELEAERFITAEEEQDYGSEFLNVVGKKAKEELLPVVKKYESKIAELEAKLQGVNGFVEQDARARMEQSLDREVPDWRDINFNPEFLTWLKLPDTYSGVIRHELLKAAYSRNDSPRVLAFFKGFLAEEAAVDPANAETGRSAAPAKPSLEQFAAPGRAKTAAATGAPAEKPVFTRADIAKFYADSAAGKFRGKEAEKDRLEAQIFEAEREGRIR